VGNPRHTNNTEARKINIHKCTILNIIAEIRRHRERDKNACNSVKIRDNLCVHADRESNTQIVNYYTGILKGKDRRERQGATRGNKNILPVYEKTCDKRNASATAHRERDGQNV